MSKALIKKVFFPRVPEARKILADKATELLELQLALIKEAATNLEFEAALKANQWLIEHIPSTEGAGIVGPSTAETGQLEDGASRVPQINIGIALTTPEPPKQIIGEVIDI